jgi:hypothetical protein
MYNWIPYFVSTYQVVFIVFNGEKAGVWWWLHIHTLVANKSDPARPENRVLGQLLHEVVWTCSWRTCITGLHTLFLPIKLVSSYSMGKRRGSGVYTSVHWWHTNGTLQVHKHWVLGQLWHKEFGQAPGVHV